MECGSNRAGPLLCLLSGWLAASASVFAKLAVAPENFVRIRYRSFVKTVVRLAPFFEEASPSSDSYHDVPVFAFRVACFGVTFILNTVMWTTFVKALQHCSSTVTASVSNAASNFIFTALFGWILFEEKLPLQWWMGSCLILLGLLIIHKGINNSSSSSKINQENIEAKRL